MKTQIYLLLVFGVAFVVNQDIQSDPIVQLQYGKIRGHVLKSTKNRPYYAFQDVPFAKPPIGDLRFKEPQPLESWNDVRNTTENKKKCIEFFSNIRDGAPEEMEDCLYANVYTPQLPGNSSSSPLPVLFSIYGGSFGIGNGDINFVSPERFMNYDIIVVIPSYRVGALGFLYNGDNVFPGNLGLKDIRFALKWTSQNIAQFGGDPKKITLGGISSGAAAVAYQMLNTELTGLFRSVILQSGTTMCPWALMKTPEYYAHKLAMALNPNITINSTSEELWNVLSKATADELKYESYKIEDPDQIWWPVIENKSAKDPILTEKTLLNWKDGNFNRVPMVIGFTSEEYIIYSKYGLSVTQLREEGAGLDNDTKWLVEEVFDSLSEETLRLAGAEMRRVFTNKTFADDPIALVKFRSNYGWKNPVIRHAELQSKYTDVYLYQLAHKGPSGDGNGTIILPVINVVGHAEDETYLYGRRAMNKMVLPTSDKLIQERILRMWTNFIIELNPTPHEDPLLQKMIWPKLNINDPAYLTINNTLSLDNNFEKYRKWKAIMEKYE